MSDDVKRYRLSYRYGVIADDGSYNHLADTSEPMVRAADYDALASRLAEAERRVKELEVSLTNAIQQLDDDMEYAELRADLSQVQDESALSELTNAKQFRAIRELLGYVEDGSGETVTISQDDVTREWCVSVGKKNYYEPCLRQALDAALSPRHQSAEGAEGEGT